MKKFDLLKDFDFNQNTVLENESYNNIGDISLPKDYMAFMKNTNGGEGFIGNNYLILWELDKLAEYNKEYEVNMYAPNIFLFGSNGGGEAFGFDLNNNMNIVQIPFIGMNIKYAEIVSNTFSNFIEKLNTEII